jgi:hypothetical protein
LRNTAFYGRFFVLDKTKMTESVPVSLPQPDYTATEGAVPKVVLGDGVDPTLAVDAHQLGTTMRSLGISEAGIANSAVYLDPKSRLQTFGTHYPNKLGRLRFRSVQELEQTSGDIVRLSTKMKGKPRDAAGMNVTLVHELEHLAQGDRRDKNVHEGHLAIWGLAAAGAVLGNRIGGRSKATKVLGTVLGAAAGHTLGYMIAPHERQERKRAGQGLSRLPEVTSSAISHKR